MCFRLDGGIGRSLSCSLRRSLRFRLRRSLCFRLRRGIGGGLFFFFFCQFLFASAGEKDTNPGHDHAEEAGTATDQQEPAGKAGDQICDRLHSGKNAERAGKAGDRKDQRQDPGRIIQHLDLDGPLQYENSQDQRKRGGEHFKVRCQVADADEADNARQDQHNADRETVSVDTLEVPA